MVFITLYLHPLILEYLQTIVFILVIAALVQLVEMILKKFVKPLYQALGVYLPLITTNCAVLGVAISNIDNGYNFGESMACSFGTSFGFLISIVILAGIREKSENNNIPKPFRGTPIDTYFSRTYGYSIYRIYRCCIRRHIWKF